MFKVGDKIVLKKDVVFEYGKVAEKGNKDTIDFIDQEGFWLRDIDIYIEHNYQNEYMALA